MTQVSIEPFARGHLDRLVTLVDAEGWTDYSEDADRTYRALTAPGTTTLVARAGERVVGGLQLDIRTRTEGYYERMGASRSLGFRLLRANLGLGEAPTDSVNKAAEPE